MIAASARPASSLAAMPSGPGAPTPPSGPPSEAGATPAPATADSSARDHGRDTTRETAASAQAARAKSSERPGAPGRAGDDFAALLIPAGDAPAAPVAVVPTPDSPGTAPEASAATPDQWLAMLAGALALPTAVTAPPPSTADGIPTPASAAPASAALPLSLPLAAPTPALSTPSIATASALPVMPALESLEPAADGAASGGETRGTFDTTLGALAAPAAPVTLAATREIAAPPPALPMPADPANGFDDGIGTHIAWMAGQRLGEARIQVNPEHLGPIEVTLQLDDARVDAQFHSTHVEVRAALEASVPRLRELLAQHGLQLGQADVGQRHGAGDSRQSAPGFAGRDSEADGAPTAPAAITHRRGLLDEYA
jgi:flagellar hook-length control protein FliK